MLEVQLQEVLLYLMQMTQIVLNSTFDLYFVLGGCAPGADESAYGEANGQTIYKVRCVVNFAGVDFDGITTINWSVLRL